jgi:hypothetical protein
MGIFCPSREGQDRNYGVKESASYALGGNHGGIYAPASRSLSKSSSVGGIVFFIVCLSVMESFMISFVMLGPDEACPAPEFSALGFQIASDVG